MSFLSLFTDGFKGGPDSSLKSPRAKATQVAYKRIKRIARKNNYLMEHHTIFAIEPQKLALWVNEQYYPLGERPTLKPQVKIIWWNSAEAQWIPISYIPDYELLYDPEDFASSVHRSPNHIIVQIPNTKSIVTSDLSVFNKIFGTITGYSVYNQDLSYGRYKLAGQYTIDQGYNIITIAYWLAVITLIVLIAYMLYCLRVMYYASK